MSTVPLHAHHIHNGQVVGAIELQHHRVTSVRRSRDMSSVRDIALALLLAAGLSTAFLAPTQTQHVTENSVPHPRVLGSSITIPLTVTVAVHAGDIDWRGSIRPVHGTLVEAIAAAASLSGTTFSYSSRGTSIYPQEQSIIHLNGVLVNDLSLPILHQSDTITLEQPSL